MAHVAAAPAAAPRRRSAMSGRWLRRMADAFAHGIDELSRVKWLDEHLTHLIELTSCHVPGIGGCDDRSRDELRIGFDELAEDRKAVDVRHHQVEHQRVV